MTDDGHRTSLADRAVPLALVGISVVALVEGVRVIAAATSAKQSGPAGVFLCVVGGLLLTSTLLATRDHRTARSAIVATDADSTPAVPDTPRPSQGRATVWKAVVLLAGYAWALPWVGFAVTTGVFLVVYLAWVARYPVWKAVLYGVVIDVVAVLLFAQAGVVLPAGAYGL